MPDETEYHIITGAQLEAFDNGLSHMVDRATSDMGREIAEAEDLMAKIRDGIPLVDVQIHQSDEWSGLYVDGKLVTYGDSYLAEERIQSMVGVKVVQDGGDWLLPDGRTPLETIEEVEARKMERLGGEEAAAAKVAEAEKLLAEAADIDGKKRFVGAA